MSAVVEKLTVAIHEKELLRALWYDGANARAGLNVSEDPDGFEIADIAVEMDDAGESFVVFQIQRATNTP